MRNRVLHEAVVPGRVLSRNQRGTRAELLYRWTVEAKLALPLHCEVQIACHRAVAAQLAVVGEHQQMIGGRVSEVEEDALLLKNPLQKVQVRLAVLGAVLQYWIATLNL